MHRDLPKKDKKVARELIDKGLVIEFEQELDKFYKLLKGWKENGADTKKTYYELYSAVINFNKWIARRYDGIGGSRYLDLVIAQLVDELYDISEADAFSAETKEDVLRSVKIRKQP